jgi:hypothetical protein
MNCCPETPDVFYVWYTCNNNKEKQVKQRREVYCKRSSVSFKQSTYAVACATFWAFSLDPCKRKVRNAGLRKGSSYRVRENGMQPWLAGMGTVWDDPTASSEQTARGSSRVHGSRLYVWDIGTSPVCRRQGGLLE